MRAAEYRHADSIHIFLKRCGGDHLGRLSQARIDHFHTRVAQGSRDHSLLDLFLQIRQIRVPVIAAVRGRALAGGSGLATACDLVLASETARFGYPEVKIGFVPAMVLAILRRNVSEKRAFELITRGEEIDAAYAKEIGLINQVFSDQTFDDDVNAYLRRFTEVSSTAIALTKSLLYQVDGLPFLEALETGADVNVIARMTEDCQQGIAKFLKPRD